VNNPFAENCSFLKLGCHFEAQKNLQSLLFVNEPSSLLWGHPFKQLPGIAMCEPSARKAMICYLRSGSHSLDLDCAPLRSGSHSSIWIASGSWQAAKMFAPAGRIKVACTIQAWTRARNTPIALGQRTKYVIQCEFVYVLKNLSRFEKCPHQESNLGCRGHNATS
jgi:hypothetical protein